MARITTHIRVILIKCVVHVLLSTLALAFAFPVLFMLANSFMSSQEAVRAYNEESRDGAEVRYISFKIIPERVSLMQYYKALLRKPAYLNMFFNSIRITFPVVAGQLIIAAMAAYAFSRFYFPLKDCIFYLYIIFMMMPLQVTLVPNYIILQKLNLIGTFWAVILPGVFSSFGVFLLRQFMVLIPDEFCEAAQMDGAGSFRVFTSIIMPQCKSAMAALVILAFVDNWNLVEQPLIFLANESMHPLSISLGSVGNDDGIIFACGFIYMFPAILIFIYGESYLIQGIQMSGIK